MSSKQHEITTNINLDAMTLLSLTGDDLSMLHKKVIVNKYLEEKTKNSKKSVATIAKDLGISKSSLDRYKKDAQLTSSRRAPNYSLEERREITAKAMETKRRNQMYKEKLKSISSDKSLTNEEFDKEMLKLRSLNLMSETASSVSRSAVSSVRRDKRGGKLDDTEEASVTRGKNLLSNKADLDTDALADKYLSEM